MLHSIVGSMNSGKTLYMTRLLNEDFLKGRIIITNYFVNFPHMKINRDFLLKLSSLGNDDYITKLFENNLISIGLDELWIWLDSRRSQENTIATWFFNQTSKSDMNIYFTAQNNKQNDSRLRNNMHKLTSCTRAVKENGKYNEISNETRFLNQEQLDLLYIVAVTYKMGIFGLEYDYTERVRAKKFINLYNTKEVIKRYKDGTN